MSALLAVAVGGAIGASARYLAVGAIMRVLPGFPWGTLTVNVMGSLAMGLLAAVLLERGGFGRWAPFLLTGVLGGFTTFSAFSLDLFYLVERGRMLAAAGYVLGSVCASVAALTVGLWVARRVLL